jgi:hypothetical protein
VSSFWIVGHGDKNLACTDIYSSRVGLLDRAIFQTHPSSSFFLSIS